MPRLLLASGSPRRRDLIRAVAADARAVATDVDESVPDGTPPDVMVRDVALRKAVAAAALDPAAVVVAADTTTAAGSSGSGSRRAPTRPTTCCVGSGAASTRSSRASR